MTERFCSEGAGTRSTVGVTPPGPRRGGRPGTSTATRLSVGDRARWRTQAGREMAGTVVGVVPAFVPAAGCLRRLGIRLGAWRSEATSVSCREKYVVDTGRRGYLRYAVPRAGAVRPE